MNHYQVLVSTLANSWSTKPNVKQQYSAIICYIVNNINKGSTETPKNMLLLKHKQTKSKRKM